MNDMSRFIEREARQTAWIAMIAFFFSVLAMPFSPGLAAFGMLAFVLVWIGCGLIAIVARRS